jgi:aminopeptidase YwaD
MAITAQPVTAKRESKKERKAREQADKILVANLQQHIAVLAADSLEGRRTGTAGEMKAVNYLAAQYQKLGLKPVGTYPSFIQAFTIDEGKTVAAETYLQTGDATLKVGEDYFPFSFSPSQNFKGMVTWGVQERGEPWLADVKEPIESNKNNPHFDLLQWVRTKLKDAAAQKATALLLYNSGTVPDSLAFAAKDRGETTVIPVIYLTVDGVKKMKAESEIATTISGKIVLEDKIRKAHNVSAYLDNGAATTIVIGAHFDHLGYGEDHNSRYTGKPEIHNGADDNASGTSAVIELARLLKEKSGNAPFNQNNYCFINFSGEELGLYGSKHFTDHPPFDLSKVNYMINLDMVGRLSDSSHALTVGGYGTSPVFSQLISTANSQPFTIKIDSSGTGPSDHTSFYRKDIPVLFFFTGLHTDYHKPGDDADKINYRGEAAIIDYIINLVQKTSLQPKLAFTKTREQSMGGGRFKVSIGIMPDYTFSGQGVRADGVIDGRAAQKAGLQTGDVIVQLGEHLVTGMETYMQALNRFNKGESTKVTVRRGDKVLEMPVTF